MARARRPVKCPDCGLVPVPVSGFCPRCLSRLPIERRIGVLPIAAGAVLLALIGGSALLANAGGARVAIPGSAPFGGQATGAPALTGPPSAMGTATAVPATSLEAVPSASAPSVASPTSTPIAVLGLTQPPQAGGLPSTATAGEALRSVFHGTAARDLDFSSFGLTRTGRLARRAAAK